MKNLIKITTLALTVGFGGFANAQSFGTPLAVETPTFLAKINLFPETYRLRVQVSKQGVNESILIMELKDANGHELYLRKFGKNEKQAVVLLNLEKLNDGIYTLEMSDKNGKTTKTFRKSEEPLVVQTANSLVALN